MAYALKKDWRAAEANKVMRGAPQHQSALADLRFCTKQSGGEGLYTEDQSRHLPVKIQEEMGLHTI